MAISTKTRASLRGLANTMNTTLQIGKGGITPALIEQVEELLKYHELVKMRVLETATFDARTAAQELAEGTGAEIVQVIGSRLVLYRENKEAPGIIVDSKGEATRREKVKAVAPKKPKGRSGTAAGKSHKPGKRSVREWDGEVSPGEDRRLGARGGFGSKRSAEGAGKNNFGKPILSKSGKPGGFGMGRGPVKSVSRAGSRPRRKGD